MEKRWHYFDPLSLDLESLDARMIYLFGHRKVLPFRIRTIDAQHSQTTLGLFQNLPTHGALTALDLRSRGPSRIAQAGSTNARLT